MAKSQNTWQSYKLGECLEKIVGGGTPSKKEPEFWNGKISWATVKDMKDGVYKLHSTVDTITQKGLNKSSSKLIPKNTVIISTRMGLGRCFIASIDTSINQDLKALFPNKNILDTKYLLWLIVFLGEKIQLLGTGTTVKGITVETLRNLDINLPPLPTQQKIAGILSAYDDLIENNTRRIEILEEMARMLYREWFVKFRFPCHEAVQFVESELGLIPEGWEVKKLDKLGFLGRGKSKHRPRNYPPLYGGKYPFIQTGEVKNTLLYITNYEQTYSEEGLAQSKLWEKETLLLTIAANIAETAIITFSACFPDSIVGFIADKNKVIPEFIKYQIDDLKEKMKSYSRGTAQDNLSLDKIKMFDFLVPSYSYMKLYQDHTESIFKKMINLQEKNINLRKTRDLLLPRLISGEIDVENLDINTGIQP